MRFFIFNNLIRPYCSHISCLLLHDIYLLNEGNILFVTKKKKKNRIHILKWNLFVSVNWSRLCMLSGTFNSSRVRDCVSRQIPPILMPRNCTQTSKYNLFLSLFYICISFLCSSLSNRVLHK